MEIDKAVDDLNLRPKQMKVIIVILASLLSFMVYEHFFNAPTTENNNDLMYLNNQIFQLKERLDTLKCK
jgi:Tfp pilus assembly protein PilN